jgi:hypothetical protein
MPRELSASERLNLFVCYIVWNPTHILSERAERGEIEIQLCPILGSYEYLECSKNFAPIAGIIICVLAIQI